MAYTSAGKKRISGGIQLSCYAEDILEVEKLVEIVDDYKVAYPSAPSNKVIGHVQVANKVEDGDITIAAYGWHVAVFKSGAAVTWGPVVVSVDAYGVPVVINYDAKTHTPDQIIGQALTHADAADADVDVLTTR